MLRVILWKEFREQRVLWFGLVLAALAVVTILMRLGTVGSLPADDVAWGILLLLSWGYGVVCGSMLLAEEREHGTLAFLDALSLSRWQLWKGKFLAGFRFCLVMVLVLSTLGLVYPVTSARKEWVEWCFFLAVIAAAGLAWGLLFSSFVRKPLHAAGLGLVAPMVAGVFFGSLSMVGNALTDRALGFQIRDSLATRTASVLAMILVPLATSAWVYSRTDRLQVTGTGPNGWPLGRWRTWRVLLWLSLRQSWALAVGIAILGIAAGLALILNDALIWPLATLTIGVLSGINVLADEQTYQGGRFLGEQRLPPVRVWLVKTAVHLALVLGALLLILWAGSVVEKLQPRGDPNKGLPKRVLWYLLLPSKDWRNEDAGLYASLALLWPLYGFVLGQICGLFFRSTLVAFVLAFILGGSLAILWVPSVLFGDVYSWQLGFVPLTLLLTVPFTLRAWFAGQTLSWRGAGRLLAGGILVALGLGFGLWYRVIEIPRVPEPYDRAEILARLPTPEENLAGRLIRQAVIAYEENVRETGKVKSVENLQAILQITHFPEAGWPKNSQDLATVMNRLFSGGWRDKLSRAADLPPGVLDDVREMSLSSQMTTSWRTFNLEAPLASHGLMAQDQGRPAVFVEDLRIGLGVVRNVRHLSPYAAALKGDEAEGIFLQGLDRWLEGLDGHPELLRSALDTLNRHIQETRIGSSDHDRVEYLLFRNTLESPDSLSSRFFFYLPFERTLAPLVLDVPWEKERLHRLGDRLFMQEPGSPRQTVIPDRGVVRILSNLEFRRNEFLNPVRIREIQTRLYSSRLKVALRLYQIETGHSAKTPEDLVPKYIPALPRDPHKD